LTGLIPPSQSADPRPEGAILFRACVDIPRAWACIVAELLFQARNWSAERVIACRADIRNQTCEAELVVMLSWVVTFLIIALIAGILGFGGIAGASVEIAKIIFFIAVVLFVISAVVGLARGRTRV
jgi:uncharacterized membrane protein YtjA (UPF0391 family)